MHNPDLCPFGLVAQGEKVEGVLLISFLASLHDFCYKITNPARPIKVEQVVKELNRALRGWVDYFRIANSSKKFGKIRLYAAKKVRKFMRGRWK